MEHKKIAGGVVWAVVWGRGGGIYTHGNVEINAASVYVISHVQNQRFPTCGPRV